LFLDRFKKKDTENPFDSQLRAAMLDMQQYETDSDEYQRQLDIVDRLIKIRQGDQPDKISRNTMAIIAANLAGLVFVCTFDRVHVLSQKGFQSIMKLPKTDSI